MQPTPIFKEQCWQYFQPSSMQIIDHQNNFDKQNYFDSQKSAFTTSQASDANASYGMAGALADDPVEAEGCLLRIARR